MRILFAFLLVLGAAQLGPRPLAAQSAPPYSPEIHGLLGAADKGNVDAQARLGYFYEMGLGVAQSDKEAVYWYHRAAIEGNAYAQSRLGSFYEAGPVTNPATTSRLKSMTVSSSRLL